MSRRLRPQYRDRSVPHLPHNVPTIRRDSVWCVFVFVRQLVEVLAELLVGNLVRWSLEMIGYLPYSIKIGILGAFGISAELHIFD